MPLTDTFVKTAKPDPAKTAGSKFADGYGLFLLVKDAGKYWRMAYRFAGKQKTLALGTYPSVTLAQARKRREEARAQLAAGIDPGVIKQAQKVIKASAAGNTFEAIAREFHETKRSGWSDSYSEKWLRNMVKDLFPHIGRMPLPDLVEAFALCGGTDL